MTVRVPMPRVLAAILVSLMANLSGEYKYGFVQRAWAAKTHEQESVMKSKPGYMRDGWNISLIFYLLLLR